MSEMAVLPSAYIIFFVNSLLLPLIVFLPGLWWNSRRRGALSAGFLAVPGIVTLAVIGLSAWVLPHHFGPVSRWITILLYAALCCDTCLRLRRHGSVAGVFRESKAELTMAALVFCLLLVQTVAVGINPLPIAQESVSPEARMPGRMIASPPDYRIPYRTGVYMHYGYNGLEHREEWFGGWTITSRGPLVPLGINALLQAYKTDPGRSTQEVAVLPWPNSTAAEGIARIYGWILNSLVLLGALELLQTMRLRIGVQKQALIWLALSPVIIIDTEFLWPKLLATYFLLLAISTVITRRYALSGLLLALAWLSHPVGALMAPAVLLFAVCRPARDGTRLTWRARIAVVSPILLGLLGTMLPWLVYKAHLGQRDIFMDYVWGDGNDRTRAVSVGSWLACRMSNFWLTLSPAAFFYSPYMRVWVYGPVSDVLRWSIQYAKTLPGNLGFCCFVFAYLALIARQADPLLRHMKRDLLFAGFLMMLVFWGFSSDGLGRQCLEPISVLLIIFAVAASQDRLRVLTVLFPFLAAEEQWVQLSGFIFVPSFKVNAVPPAAWACFVLSAAAACCLVAYARLSPEPGSDLPQPFDSPVLMHSHSS